MGRWNSISSHAPGADRWQYFFSGQELTKDDLNIKKIVDD
jgi:hypothetical protein